MQLDFLFIYLFCCQHEPEDHSGSQPASSEHPVVLTPLHSCKWKKVFLFPRGAVGYTSVVIIRWKTAFYLLCNQTLHTCTTEEEENVSPNCILCSFFWGNHQVMSKSSQTDVTQGVK